MSKKSGEKAGSIIGSIIKFFLTGITLLIKIILRLLLFLGLWIPAVYILFGVALYFIFGFNPLDWHLEGQLYVSGLIACSLCSLVVAIRNIIVKPAKSVYKGYKKPIWKKPEDDDKEEIIISKRKKEEIDERVVEDIKKPRPNIYYSTIEENTLVHEYEDRFEIFTIVNNKARLDRVEYKNE